MKTKIIKVSLPLSLLLVTHSLPNLAKDNANEIQNTNPDFSKPYGYHLQPILERIEATSDQKIKITAIVESYRSKIEPMRNQYTKLNQGFLVDIVKGQDSNLIMSEQTKLGHLYTEITSQYCLMSMEVRKLLNPTQIVKYEQYKKEQGWSKNKK